MANPPRERPVWFEYFLVHFVNERGEKYVLGLMISFEEMAALELRTLRLEEIEKMEAATLDKLIEKYMLPTTLAPTEEFLDCNDYVLQRMKKDKSKVFRIGHFQACMRVV